MTQCTRRRFLAGTAAALAAAGARRPLPAHGQPAIKLGTAVLGEYSLAGPFILGVERQMFRAEGLNVEFVPFRGGPDLVKGVGAGDILLGASGTTDIIVFREAGMPLKMLGTLTEGNHFTLNVAPAISNVAELKGKAIGVTRPGATTWVFGRILARHQGWDPERDVKLVGLGGLDAQLTALGRGEIQGFIWGDAGAVMQLEGKSKLLMRLDTVTPKWISQMVYASEDGIRRHGDTIRRALKVIYAAQRLMSQKTAEAAELIAKRLGWTVEGVLAAHKVSGTLLSHDGTVSIEALARVQEVLLEHGVVKKRLPLEEHITREFTPVRV